MSATAFLSSAEPVCPPDLLAAAGRTDIPRVAIARAGWPLPMQAAKEAVEARLMEPVFVGEPDRIHAQAERLDWDIGAFDVIEAHGEQAAAEAAAALCGSGRSKVLMKGQLHSDVFIRAAIGREAGLRTGDRLIHVFYITPPDGGRGVMISDAAVNIAPAMETRQQTVRQMARLGHVLGLQRPRIAILSATESVLESLPSSVSARALADWASHSVPDAEVSGPLALDLAMSPASVATKGLTGNPVAGRADGIAVPDIVTGNALAKSLVYVGGGCAAGVVLGAKVPILLNSRADPTAARLASVCLADMIDAAGPDR